MLIGIALLEDHMVVRVRSRVTSVQGHFTHKEGWGFGRGCGLLMASTGTPRGAKSWLK